MNNQLLVSESLWITLANTLYISNGEKKDLLGDKDQAGKWLTDIGLSIEIVNDQYEDFLEKLVGLREMIHRLLQGIVNEQVILENEVRMLNQFISQLSTEVYFTTEENSLSLNVRCNNSYDEILFRIVQSISDDLDAGKLDKVRQCKSPTCILYFVDKSKAGKRIWCDMNTCGNRKKASKHYRKKKME
jgi:predicted RNA-binding Zn ribbon-like protein